MRWPADKVHHREAAQLIPDARNARKHSPDQINQLERSMKRWGWTIPVLIDEADKIIAGHGRVLAAANLNITRIPCLIAEGWTDDEKRAYMIADNKLTENATWDYELLLREIEQLHASGFDATLTGFTADELEQLITPANDAEKDWQGMPAFSNSELDHRTLVVHFKDENAFTDFQQRLGQNISPQAKYIWHPWQADEPYRDSQYKEQIIP